MDILASLRKFDGKHTDPLEKINAGLPRTDEAMEALLAFAEHEEIQLQIGSTWILKRWHEEGVPLLATHVPALVHVLNRAAHWEVQLHLLQILASIGVPSKQTTALKKMLRKLLSGDNKFVRAWAYSVLARIGEQEPSSRKQVKSLLDDAEHDEAASVRARVRQIRKRYSWARPPSP